MIKNAKPMLAPTMSNASSITLPFGKADTAEPTAGIHSNDNYGEDTAATSFGTTDKTDNMKPMTAKPIKSRHSDAVTIPFGKTGDNKELAPTTAKPIRLDESFVKNFRFCTGKKSWIDTFIGH